MSYIHYCFKIDILFALMTVSFIVKHGSHILCVKKKITPPNVQIFTHVLNRERKEELDGEIFEILLTFSDFMAFKEMVLDYRAVSSRHGLFKL